MLNKRLLANGQRGNGEWRGAIGCKSLLQMGSQLGKTFQANSLQLSYLLCVSVSVLLVCVVLYMRVCVYVCVCVCWPTQKWPNYRPDEGSLQSTSQPANEPTSQLSLLSLLLQPFIFSSLLCLFPLPFPHLVTLFSTLL